MKKINHNTRKTILIDGEKVTASVTMLNRISIWIAESADLDKKRGFCDMSKISHEISRDIYNQLDEMGYYDNVKN